MYFPSGILYTTLYSLEPKRDFLRKKSSHSLTTVLKWDPSVTFLRCQPRFDRVKILSEFLTMEENLTLSKVSRQWKVRIILLHREASRKQLIVLVKCIYNQLGKSICFQWQKDKPKRSYKSIRAEVHSFAYSKQSKTLLALIKDLKNTKIPFNAAIIKARLVDILAEPVDLPYYRKKITGEDPSFGYQLLAHYFSNNFLDDSHVLHHLECSPVLVPSSFQDLVPVAKELCLTRMLTPIRSRITHGLAFDTIIEGVIKRCHQVGLRHLIPLLWEELSCQDPIRGHPDPIKKLEAQFNYFMAVDNLAKALELAITWPEDRRYSFTSYYERSSRVEQVILSLAQGGNEVRAFDLVLSNPSFQYGFSRMSLHRDYNEKEISRSGYAHNFNPFKIIAQLLLITCHLRGVEGAIQLAKDFPTQIRNYAINHLILRLTHPDIYWSIWKDTIKEYTMPKKEMSLSDIRVTMEKIQIGLFAAMAGVSISSPEEACPLKPDIAKAIVLSKTYPIVKGSDSCHFHRSLYLFAALRQRKEYSLAEEYLKTLSESSTIIGMRAGLKDFNISIESMDLVETGSP